MEIKILASGSKGNCYLVDDGQTKIILEAGISWREIQRKLDFKTSEIQACLISHMHQDHCKAIKEVEKFGIPFYSPKEMAASEFVYIGSWAIHAFDAVHDVPCQGFVMRTASDSRKKYRNSQARLYI